MTEWTKVAAQLYAQQQIVKEAVKLQEDLKDKLKHLSKNGSHAESHYQFTKELRAGTIDYRAIPELKEINLEAYRKPPVQYWTLTLRVPGHDEG